MKKLLIATAALSLLSCSPAFATDLDAEICVLHGVISGRLMETRQAGVPLQKTLEVINERAPEFKDDLLEAYSSPRYSRKDNQKEAIVEFTNKKMLECMERIDK